MISLRLRSLLVSTMFAVAASGGMTPGPHVPEAPYMGAGTGDFNADGLTDFIHERSGSGQYFLINRGGGNFTRHDFDLDGYFMRVHQTLDVNGDGRTDLIANDNPMHPPGAPPPRPLKSYRLFITDEHLLPYAQPIELGKGVAPYVADADGDGKDDLLLFDWVAETKSSKVTVMISRGDGTFAAREPFPMPSDPRVMGYRLESGDVNHDGIPDIVLRVQDGLVILRGTGGGDFAVSSRYVPSERFGAFELSLQDINGDGHLDAVIPSEPRAVRVFLGDGKGGFPRVTLAKIPKLHDLVGSPYAEKDMHYSMTPQLAFGQFVRSGRTEILAGTIEGDLVVLAWENNQLREVDRRETEFVHPVLYVGEYFQRGKTDVFSSPRGFNGYEWAKPRFFTSVLDAPVHAEVAVRGRTRAVRGFAPVPVTRFDVQMKGDACMTTPAATWTLVRDGIFGFSPGGNVETVQDGDILAVRLKVPWAPDRVEGFLERKGNDYVGKLYSTKNECGWSRTEVVVTPR